MHVAKNLAEQNATNNRSPLLPLWLKVGYTGFMAVLVPYYWIEYGPTNFLYFCDIALFLTLATVWSERAIYASMAAVGILLPQLFWQVDFLGTCVGFPIAGLTGYMFDPEISLAARGLSFFHFWLPILLVFLVWRLGYDKRGLIGWMLMAWVAMSISYAFLPAPGDIIDYVGQPQNVNYVYGLGTEPQEWISANAWFAALMLGLPALVYIPTHFTLKWLNDNVGRPKLVLK